MDILVPLFSLLTSLLLLVMMELVSVYFFSGQVQLLSSQKECERLFHALPNCEIRKFTNSGYFLFLVRRSLSFAYKKKSFFILSLIHMIEEALTIYTYGWERGVEKENINFYILIKKVTSIRINEKRYHRTCRWDG